MKSYPIFLSSIFLSSCPPQIPPQLANNFDHRCAECVRPRAQQYLATDCTDSTEEDGSGLREETRFFSRASVESVRWLH
jgi:hypothetical protein